MATVRTTKSKFLDLDLNFSRHPITGDVSKLANAGAISRSLKNLVLTTPHDVPFHPEISCQVRDLLFDQMTPDSLNLIQRTIEYAVANFEPRVELITVGVIPDYSGRSLSVNLVYNIIGLADQYQTSFVLERTL